MGKKFLRLSGILVMAIATLYIAFFFYQRHRYVISDDAFLKADMVSVSTEDVSGKIIRLFKNEFDAVKKGEPLFKVNDALYKADVESLKKQLESQEEKLKTLIVQRKRLKVQLLQNYRISNEKVDQLKHRIDELEKQRKMVNVDYLTTLSNAKSFLKSSQKAVDFARQNLIHYQNEYRRYRNLYRKRVISKERLEDMETAYKDAVYRYSYAISNLNKAKQDLKKAEVLREKVGMIDDEIDSASIELSMARSQVLISKAEMRKLQELNRNIKSIRFGIDSLGSKLKKAEILLNRTLVGSPISGFIARRWSEKGDFVSPGLPVYSVYNPKSVYVVAWIEDDKVNDINLGSKAKVKLDVCGGRTFDGRVYAIGTSSGSEFALIPRDTTQGEYTKVTQRVPVKIKLSNIPISCMKVGTNVTVYIKRKR